jgi:hydrogenase-4 component E
MNDLLVSLNDLAGGLFLLGAIAMVATRQIRGCLRFFIWQSICLAASAALMAGVTGVRELLVVSLINLATKVILIPWLLRTSVPETLSTRREISQVLSIPSTLLVALLLAVFSYFAGRLLLSAAQVTAMVPNVPVGIAALLLGVYTISVRREAVPQLFGLLSMENGAFFVGIAFAPDLPLIAEIAAAFDALVIVLLVAILTRAIHERVGTTDVGSMATLKEETRT